jgi:hypothetical protein
MQMLTDEEIKRIIKKHYDRREENIIFQMILRIGREISESSEYLTLRTEWQFRTRTAFRLNQLEIENAVLKGEEPPPEIAIG